MYIIIVCVFLLATSVFLKWELFKYIGTIAITYILYNMCETVRCAHSLIRNIISKFNTRSITERHRKEFSNIFFVDFFFFRDSTHVQSLHEINRNLTRRFKYFWTVNIIMFFDTCTAALLLLLLYYTMYIYYCYNNILIWVYIIIII